MPKRENERWASLHPPYCTCVSCAKRRVARGSLRICPSCKEKSLFYNAYVGLWECLNPRCKRVYKPRERGVQSKERDVVKGRASSMRSSASSGKFDPYVDKILRCVDCGQLFSFTAKEQRFFASKGFVEPMRCYGCRRARRKQFNKSTVNVNHVRVKSRQKKRTGVVVTITLLLLGGVFIFWLTNGFSPDTEPPSIPILVSPQNQLITENHVITLEWSKVEDSSAVKYEVQVGDNDTFANLCFVGDKIKTCSTLTSRLDDGIYYWRVRAIDGAGNTSSWSQTRQFWCYTQPPYAKTFGGQRINLINNWDAKDPTWQQLVSFLEADKTDSKAYAIFSFPCGAFAEEVHNNSEAAGIKAAWVALDFRDKSGGHALNAFKTTDRGLVYIDCTGEDIMSFRVPRLPPILSQRTTSPPVERDKVAYVEVGKQYGLIALGKATSLDYTFYEQTVKKWEYLQAKIQEYEWLMAGRTIVYDQAEYARLKRMYDEIKAMERDLGGYWWPPLDVVKDVKTYW